jgi:hypothetical protein
MAKHPDAVRRVDSIEDPEFIAPAESKLPRVPRPNGRARGFRFLVSTSGSYASCAPIVASISHLFCCSRRMPAPSPSGKVAKLALSPSGLRCRMGYKNGWCSSASSSNFRMNQRSLRRR